MKKGTQGNAPVLKLQPQNPVVRKTGKMRKGANTAGVVPTGGPWIGGAR
jgi:hypothetical protein